MQELKEKTIDTVVENGTELLSEEYELPAKKTQEPKSRDAGKKWLFLLAMPLAFTYLELLLRITGGDELRWVTWIYPIGFAFSFGFLADLICLSIPNRRAGRYVGLFVLLLATILFLTEFFVKNSFYAYMDLVSVIGGASDVATGFTDTAFATLRANIVYILLFCLPFVLFVIFWGRTWRPKLRRKAVPVLLLIAVVCYLLSFGLIQLSAPDRAAYSEQFQFDNGVRTFGLLTGLRLDCKNALFPGSGDSLVVLDPDTSEAEDPNSGEIEYGYNVMDIPFEELIAQETNTQLQQIHTYVSSLTPSQKNEYTGLFAGKNLIMITAEAFAAEAIDPELTPTLYRLANQGIVFTDYYQPAWGGSTSTGEYSILSGMIPTSGVSSIQKTVGQNLYFTIGNQLDRLGYYSVAYHNNSYTYYDRHETHTNFGYSSFIGIGNGMEQGVVNQWPQSDLEMMEFTVDQYINQQPFSVYYMTVSGHCLYHPGSNAMTDKNWAAVTDLPYSDAVKGYYSSQLELEYGLAHLVSALEEAGIADDTVIMLTTDHYPYGLEYGSTWNNSRDYLSELYGYTVTNAMERDHNALIIWSGSLEGQDPIVVDTPVYSLDIIPTLSNLFGFEYDSRLLVGRDVFSDQEPLVLWMDYSWLTDKGWYNAASGVFTPNEGVTVDETYVERISAEVKNKFAYSKTVLAYDYFNILFGADVS